MDALDLCIKSHAFSSMGLKDVTKSQLGSDSLSESWPMSFMRSSMMSTTGVLKEKADSTSTTSTPPVDDLLSLAWLQKDYILDIAPLDQDEEDERPQNLSLSNFKQVHQVLEERVDNNTEESPAKYCSDTQSKLSIVNDSNIFTQQNSSDPNSNRRAPKPAYSYTHLIFLAIESSPQKCRTVNQIYTWCETHFPYFRSAGPGWKNSLRHNLSINKCFKRIPRDGRVVDSHSGNLKNCTNTSEDSYGDDFIEGPGRGAYWTVEPTERHQLMEAVKRNPWTYRTGLAAIPQLLASLPASTASQIQQTTSGSATSSPLNISAPTGPLNLSISGSGPLGQSSSDEPFGSVTPGSSSDTSSAAENSSFQNGADDETSRYLSMLHHLHLAAKAREKQESADHLKEDTTGKGKTCRHQRLDFDIENDERRRLSSSYLNKTSEDVVSLSEKLNSSELKGVLDLLKYKSKLGHSKFPCDSSSDSKKETNCDRCDARRRRRMERRLLHLSKAGLPLASNRHHPISFGRREVEESFPKRRGASACFVTPAPSLDHEYAKFQAQLHPPTNFSDDEEADDVAADETSSGRLQIVESTVETMNEDVSVKNECLEENTLKESDVESESTVSEVEQSPPLKCRARNKRPLSPAPVRVSKRKRYVPRRVFKPVGWTRGTSWEQKRFTAKGKDALVNA